MKKAFTIVELLVAVGLLTGLLAASGIIFKSAINAQRTATATAQITRKLRTITDQLTADFEHLRKDSLIFLVWVPYPVLDEYGAPIDENGDGIYDEYENFDRVLFFTTGNFHTYHQRYGDIRGNIARVSYMLARNGDGFRAKGQYREDRILARSQHILTTVEGIPQNLPDFGNIPIPLQDVPNETYIYRNNTYEHDWAVSADWKNSSGDDLFEMLTVATDIQILRYWDNELTDPTVGGLIVNPEDPNSIHMLLAEGVGEFRIQGWFEPEQRWVPEVDPDGNGDLADSDFILEPTTIPPIIDSCDVPGIWYPEMGFFFGVQSSIYDYPVPPLTETYFNEIPGLGPALKFTFTLYDSRGIFPEGKTFTHIVYLDN